MINMRDRLSNLIEEIPGQNYEYVGTKEAADILNISLSNLINTNKRREDFPKPYQKLRGTTIWLKTDIVDWGKINGYIQEEELMKSLGKKEIVSVMNLDDIISKTPFMKFIVCDFELYRSVFIDELGKFNSCLDVKEQITCDLRIEISGDVEYSYLSLESNIFSYINEDINKRLLSLAKATTNSKIHFIDINDTLHDTVRKMFLLIYETRNYKYVSNTIVIYIKPNEYMSNLIRGNNIDKMVVHCKLK